MFAGPYMIELHVTSLGCRSGRLVGLMRHFCETPYVTDCRSIIISLYVHHWGLLFGGGSPRPRGRGRDQFCTKSDTYDFNTSLIQSSYCLPTNTSQVYQSYASLLTTREEEHCQNGDNLHIGTVGFKGVRQVYQNFLPAILLRLLQFQYL